MKKLVAFVSAFLVLSLILTACAKPPAEEMNQAIDAVTRAENDANAVTYAGNTLLRARDALTKMQTEADAKRYDAAKNYAAEAVSAAERAIQEGRTAAARARDEAASLVNSLAAPLAETSATLDYIRDDDTLALNYESLSGEMDQARRVYDDARQSLQTDEYRDAVTQGQVVRSLLADINGQIVEAALAASRKK